MVGNPVGLLPSYELRHLVVHLIEAGRLDDLQHLLSLEDSDRQNAWYQAKDSTGDLDDYTADLSAALVAAQSIPVTGARYSSPCAQLAVGYRYALMLASVNSVAGRLEPALLVALIRGGLWSAKDALASARRVPENTQRAEAVVAVVPHLPEPLQTAAAWEVLETPEEKLFPDRVCGLLADLALVAPERVREAALSRLVEHAQRPGSRGVAGALTAVLDLLTLQQIETLVCYALGLIDRVSLDPMVGATEAPRELLEVLIPRLSWSSAPVAQLIKAVVSKALAEIDGLPPERQWLPQELLRTLAPIVPDQLAPLVERTAARPSWPKAWRRLQLTKSEDPRRDEAKQQAVQAAMDSGRWDALVQVLPFAADADNAEILHLALADAGKFRNRPRFPDEAAEAFGRIAQAVITGSAGDRAIFGEVAGGLKAAAASLQHYGSLNPFRVDALAEIADDMPPALRETLINSIVAAARRLHPNDKSFALAALAARLNGSQQASLFAEVMETLRDMGPSTASEALKWVAPLLPASAIPDAMRIVRIIDDAKSLRWVLAQTAPFRSYRLGEDLVARAEEAVRVAGERWAGGRSPADQIPVIVAFAQRLSGHERARLLVMGLDLAVDSHDLTTQMEAVEALTPLLTGCEDDNVHDAWRRAVARVLKPLSLPQRTLPLVTALLAAEPRPSEGRAHHRLLRRRLPDRQRLLTHALDLVRMLKGVARAHELASLIPFVPEDQRITLADEALTCAFDDSAATSATLVYGYHAEGNYLAAYRAETLALAARHLPQGQRLPALAKAEAALAATRISRSPPDTSSATPDAGSAITADHDAGQKATALAALLIASPPRARPGLLTELISAAHDVGGQMQATEALASVVPYLDPAHQPEAVSAALSHARTSRALGLWADLQLRIGPQPVGEILSALRLDPTTLAARSRDSLFSEIGSLVPLLAHLGSSELIDQLVAALTDVSRWWP